MISRVTGKVSACDGLEVSLEIDGVPVCLEILVPAYLAAAMGASIGQRVTFHTLHYLEGQGQGASYTPRLIGFATPAEKRFFEVFTTVKGIGNRRALRALKLAPSEVARAIASKDAATLRTLPEIGPRTAESMIAELKGKVEEFMAGGGEPRAAASTPATVGAAADAAGTLVALGETRVEADRLVRLVLERGAPEDANAIVAAVFAARGR